MKVEISRRTVKWILVGLAIVISIVLIVIAYRRRSNLVWPVTGTKAAEDTSLETELAGFQDTYNLALIDAMKRPASEQPALIVAAEAALNASINGAVATYVNNKCPAANGNPPASSDAAATTIWDEYQTDLGKVQKAYYSVLKTATSSTSPSTDQIQLARKADITGATRKYLARRCPSFYVPSSGTDPTSTYQAWTSSSAASKPSSGAGIHVPSVTSENVKAWLPYAAKVYTSSAAVNAVSPAAGSMTVSIPLLSAADIAVNDTIQFTYQTMDPAGAVITPAPVNATVASIVGNTVTLTIPDAVKPAPGEGIIIPSESLLAKAYMSDATLWKSVNAAGVPNWKLARDAGPGTYPTPAWAA